jgi:hypothetical protein
VGSGCFLCLVGGVRVHGFLPPHVVSLCVAVPRCEGTITVYLFSMCRFLKLNCT